MTTVQAVYPLDLSPSTQDMAKPNIAFLERHASLKNISSPQLVECTGAVAIDAEGELKMKL